MQKKLIEKIISFEWKMFQNTQNIGGRAWCQDDRLQFEANRRGQFLQWDEETLALYLEDLERADTNEKNLLAFKYAYMMESTDPEGFQRIRKLLPQISGKAMEAIEEMVQITLMWAEEFAHTYPELSRRARPVRKTEDRLNVTSVETYFRGELFTYSEATLKSLLLHYRKCAANAQNLYEQSVAAELQFLYHLSLSQIEDQLMK